VDEIVVASQWKYNQKLEEAIDQKRFVKRFKLCSYGFGKGLLAKAIQYIEFILVVFWKYKKVQFEFVNCHSLLVLPIGVLLKRFGRTKVLIYDPHELETERVGLVGKRQKMSKWFEKKLIRHVDKIIVVCDPIANWYRNEYSLENVHVIRNMPNQYKLSHTKSTRLKDNFNIPHNHVLYIYQGVLSKERGVDTLLKVFDQVHDDKHIVFMGFGDSESVIKEVAKTAKNIHFQPAVKSSEIIDYTSSADIGIFFISGQVCLSYQYCLPNKFGEYLIAGLPVLVSSSLSYLSRLVLEENCGWALNANSTIELIEFVRRTNKQHVSDIQKNVQRYSESLGWEFDEIKYVEIYR
jgi:glycosyltransferase involved in cell wall biosynthesis